MDEQELELPIEFQSVRTLYQLVDVRHCWKWIDVWYCYREMLVAHRFLQGKLHLAFLEIAAESHCVAQSCGVPRNIEPVC